MKGAILLTLVYGVLLVPAENKAFKEFAKGNHLFTAAVYKEVLKNEQGNFLMSPLSTETVLALINEGAKGATSTELVSALHFPETKEKTQKAFKSFLPSLKKANDGVQLLSANRIYTGKDFKLEDDFQTAATEVYDSGIENVDLEKKEETAATINNWVENKTNHKIKNLVEPDSIDDAAVAILVNALYFSGKWQKAFKMSDTYKEKFFKTEEDSVGVDTMHQTEQFNYYESLTLNAKFLQLGYKGSDIKLVIVLPNEKEGLASLEQHFEQLLAPQNFSNQLVSLSIPKFTTETTIQFLPILKNLGVKKIFSQEADLSGISSTYKNLYVGKVIQKTFIDVTEKGTEAAAATRFEVYNSSLTLYKDTPQLFKADHPFLYYIELDEVILFTGRVLNP